MKKKEIEFLRKKDYQFIEELGQGACGKTVLLRDPILEENFVCKKYVPYDESMRQELFDRFKDEIKILHRAYHKNVVRVFNYYVYPEKFAGYILMEHISGAEIDQYLANNPEQVNEIFSQAVEGFRYLEESKILHRDIRMGNILVGDNGALKIIDFGFGKTVTQSDSYDKSISLNWWCDLPPEFDKSIYDFATEVYFVGKLFETVIKENSIDHFKYKDVLRRMCHMDREDRFSSFVEVDLLIKEDSFLGIGFEEEEKVCYRQFADLLTHCLTKIESDATIDSNHENIRLKLENVYRNSMLEEYVPDSTTIISIFIKGAYYRRKEGFRVDVLGGFVNLLKSVDKEKRKIIYANLHTRISSIPRYADDDLEDVPF